METKISELIEILQSKLKAHGDLTVKARNIDGEFEFIISVEILEDEFIGYNDRINAVLLIDAVGW